MEVWKDIEGYEGYQVSNLGNARSLDRMVGGPFGSKRFAKGRILKLHCQKTGYLTIDLCNEGKKPIKRPIHRLVAEAFIPNPNNLPMINHRNEVKTDNRVENLEWCDAKYNNNYGTVKERIAITNTNGKKSKRVLQYTKDGKFIKEWPSVGEVTRQTGYSQGTVSKCCRGEQKIYKGYIWRYA